MFMFGSNTCDKQPRPRPEYESQNDRNNEQAIIAVVESKWHCKAQKLKKRLELDFALIRNGKIVAFAEVKQRNVLHDTYKTFAISLHKWLKAKELSEACKIPVFFVIGYKDGIRWVKHDLTEYEMFMGGRTDRGDAQDVEPMIHIPIKQFSWLKAGN